MRDYKGEFYEKMMMIKLRLPENHTSKNILVSDCYNECINMNVKNCADALKFICNRYKINMNFAVGGNMN